MYSDAIYSVKKLSVAQYFKMIKTFLYMRWDKKKKGTKGLVHVRYIRYINSRRKKYIYIHIFTYNVTSFTTSLSLDTCVHVNPLHLHARDKAGSKPDWPTL